MKTAKEDELKMENDNIIPFERAHLLTGGKGPPNDTWLTKIEPGTTILVQKRPFQGQPREALCMEYTVVRHEEDTELKTKVTLLYSDLNPPEMYIWVNSLEFSKITDLVLKSKAKKNVLD